MASETLAADKRCLQVLQYSVSIIHVAYSQQVDYLEPKQIYRFCDKMSYKLKLDVT